MDAFVALHRAIFDELERQGRFAVDAVALAHALSARFRIEEHPPLSFPAHFRCANGSCDG